MEKELRKQQNILGISGLAVIVFGIWSIAKMIIFAIATPGGFSELLGLEAAGITDAFETTVYIIVLIVFLIIALGVRFLIGLSARAESKGKKKSIFYLIIAGFLALLSLAGMLLTFLSFFAVSLFDGIVTIVVELTSILAYLEVIISSAKCRKIRKLLSEGQ